MKKTNVGLLALLAMIALPSMGCGPGSDPLITADFYAISDDQCQKAMTLNQGRLSVSDGTTSTEIGTFTALASNGELVPDVETDFTDRQSNVSGKVKVVSATLAEVGQAMQREQSFIDAIEQADIQTLFLVESRNIADYAKPCSLFAFSAPITTNTNSLLIGQCPGALFFNGADSCNKALKILKDAADAASVKLGANQ